MVVAAFARLHESQSLEQAARWVEALYVDAQGLPCTFRFVHEFLNDRCTYTRAAVLGKNRYVDNAYFCFDVCNVEAADGISIQQDDQVLASAVMLAVVKLLRIELHPDKSLSLGQVPIGQRQLFKPGAPVHAQQKWLILLDRRAKRHNPRVVKRDFLGSD